MAGEKRLLDNLRAVMGSSQVCISQGIVKSVDGDRCSVDFAGLVISDIRLRASLADVNKKMLVVPKVGSAVIVGSLSGDLDNLVVLQVDEVESVTVNGGELGGLVKIDELKDQLGKMSSRIDKIISALSNSGTVAQDGGAAYKSNIAMALSVLEKENFENIEDDKVKH